LPHFVAVGRRDSKRGHLTRSQRPWACPGMLDPLRLTEEVMELDRGLNAIDALGRPVHDESVDDEKDALSIDTILDDDDWITVRGLRPQNHADGQKTQRKPQWTRHGDNSSARVGQLVHNDGRAQ